jgi:GT2 family glycosyltransferase
MKVSIVVPTYNGAGRIGDCLRALLAQQDMEPPEIIVVDDGSTDATQEVVRGHDGVRLIQQANAGPAAARNHGARAAGGDIVVFTDDDCVPTSNWLSEMVAPFNDDAAIIGTKGRYRTTQRRIAARFIQLEYEDKYAYMARHRYIDFIDTYAAAYRRPVFMEAGGYDEGFPVPCAEDVDLSYRLSCAGHKMVFNPKAVVYHTHPETLVAFLKKKYRFAYWRVLAVRKSPSKGLKDSHTPPLMKAQLLFAPALAGALFAATGAMGAQTMAPVLWVLAGFALTTIPFVVRAFPKDPLVALLSPMILAARATAQFLGVTGAMVRFSLRRPEPAIA